MVVVENFAGNLEDEVTAVRQGNFLVEKAVVAVEVVVLKVDLELFQEISSQVAEVVRA